MPAQSSAGISSMMFSISQMFFILCTSFLNFYIHYNTLICVCQQFFQKINRACALLSDVQCVLPQLGNVIPQNFLAQLAGLEYAANADDVGVFQKSLCDVVGFIARAGDDRNRLVSVIYADVGISDSACHSHFLLNTFPRTCQDRNGQSWSCPAVRTSLRPRQAQRSACSPALCHCPCAPEQTGNQNKFSPISCPCCRQQALWWCSRLRRCQTFVLSSFVLL